MRDGVDEADKTLINIYEDNPELCRTVSKQLIQAFLAAIGSRGVRRVAFLPKELRRTKEQPCSHLPADDIRPLIDQNRQVAIRLHPASIACSNNRFAGWSHDIGFFERPCGNQLAIRAWFETMVRDDGTFLGKTFDMCRSTV